MGHHNAPGSRPSKITIPERAHPLAKAIFAEMARARKTYDQIEWESGVLRSTLKSWRCASMPGLDTASAVLGALGWDVLPVPKASTLPNGLRADLEALAAKHCTSLPCLEFIAAAVGRRPAQTIDARQRREHLEAA